MSSFHPDKPIEVLGLSASARHCLEEAGLCTVLQVAIAWHSGDVLKHWGSDPKTTVRTLLDIRETLESYLLRHPDVAELARSIGTADTSSSASLSQELSHAQPDQSGSPDEASVTLPNIMTSA